MKPINSQIRLLSPFTDTDSHTASDLSQSPGPMVTRPADESRVPGKGPDDRFLSDSVIREAQNIDENLVKNGAVAASRS